ncbi:Collagen alpha-1(XII) chain [Mizuhopecten yessoensis]|uniref:Collagen alpha-1(XII) chain n=1 Tax=Mizuhopecten yessoensis TaxID=6573 RepID=A0A210PX16_MIZYE|nr:Collagen alpha-1(XII) chain [Mizuhopecten yessoensis]
MQLFYDGGHMFFLLFVCWFVQCETVNGQNPETGNQPVTDANFGGMITKPIIDTRRVPATHPKCLTQMVDVVFLLDSSGSMGEMDFRKLLDFVSVYAQYFTVGPSNVQMSVISFASDVTIHFDLNTYDNSAAIINAVQNIPYKNGGTHTEKALQMALYHSFTRQTGDRSYAKNVLLVITDGYSYDREATLSAASMLKLYQIETFAVGVGQGVDISELQGIATDSRHVFTATNFDTLSTLRSKLNLFSCT